MKNPLGRICPHINRISVSAAIFAAGFSVIAVNAEPVSHAAEMPVYSPAAQQPNALSNMPVYNTRKMDRQRRKAEIMKNEPEQVLCGAYAVYAEASNQTKLGQRGIIENVLNRVDSRHYPDTNCGVVFQRKQYSFANKGNSNWDRVETDFAIRPMTPAVKNAIDITIDAMIRDPEDRFITGLHYLADYAEPDWRQRMPQVGVVTVDDHVFFATDRP